MANQSENVKIKVIVDGAEGGAKSFGDLEKSMFKSSLSADLAARAISGVVGVIGSGIGIVASFAKQGLQLAISFEKQMSNIKALTGASNEQIKAVEQLSYKLGQDTKYSALEAAEGIEELLKAGVKIEDIMGGAAAGALDLAAAGDLSVAEAAEIASTALNAFSKDALTVTQAADLLAGAANASATNVQELKFGLSQSAAVAAGAGLTFKDTATALAVFAQNGLKGSDAGTSLKTMLLNLQPTTDKQIKLFRELGILTKSGSNLFYDQKGHIKDLASISETLQTHLAGLTDQQRSLALEQMFGTDALRAANILFKEGAVGITEMATAMGQFTAADVAAEKVDNLGGAIDFLRSTLETKLTEAFSQPLPGLQELVRWMGNLLNAVDVTLVLDAFKRTLDVMKPSIDLIWQSLRDLKTILVEAGIGTEIKDIGDKLGTTFTQFIIDRVKSLADRLSDLIEYLKTDEGKQALQDLKTVIGDIGNAMKDSMDQISHFFSLLERNQGTIDKSVEALRRLKDAYNGANDVSKVLTNPVGSGVGNSILSKLGIKTHALGSLNAPGGMTMVGERGPELMNVPQGSKVTSNNQTFSMMVRAMKEAMGSGAVNNNISVGNVAFGGGNRTQMQEMDMFSNLLMNAV